MVIIPVHYGVCAAVTLAVLLFAGGTLAAFPAPVLLVAIVVYTVAAARSAVSVW